MLKNIQAAKGLLSVDGFDKILQELEMNERK